MSERILIQDRIITKIDAVKREKGHFRMETCLFASFLKQSHAKTRI